MARLARVTQIIFGSGGNTPTGGFGAPAAGNLATEVATSNTIANIMAGASWIGGWLGAVLGGSKFPVLEDMNSIDYVHSTQIAYILQQGIPEYDAITTYYTNNIVVNPNTYQVYGSVTNSNAGNALSDSVNWKLLVDLSTISTGNTYYNGGTSTGSANAQVCASVTPTGFTLTNGFTLTFIAGYTNSGAATMDANSTGATEIYKNSGAGPVALTGSEITAGNTVSITYNSTISKYVITNSGGLLASNNLSDVASTATSLSNLGGVATTRTLTAAGCVTGGGTLAADRTFTVTAASSSDQHTGTSTTHPVVPNVQQNHPSAAKAWVQFAGATGTIAGSYNVTSVTRNGVGNYTVNFTNAMADTNYAPFAMCSGPITSNASMRGCLIHTIATGSFSFYTYNGATALEDQTVVSCLIFGLL